MSSVVSHILKSERVTTLATPPRPRGRSPAGEPKPKPVDPQYDLHRTIVGRAVVIKAGLDHHSKAANKIVRNATPKVNSETWRRIKARQLDCVGIDIMYKLARLFGINPTQIIGEHERAASDLGVELSMKSLDRVEIYIRNSKVKKPVRQPEMADA